MRWNPVEQMQDLVNKFGSEERIKQFQTGELMLVDRAAAPARGQILAFNQNVSLPAGPFVLDRCFTKSNPKVKFSFIDEKLPRLFSKSSGQLAASQIATHTLLVARHDPDIMASIPAHSKRFIKLGQFGQLLQAQGQGQEGPLLVNGYANIAYILDDNGAPWAVRADWRGEYGWLVGVYSVARGLVWYDGDQVLSQVAA